MTASDIYQQTIKPLTVADRLRLAAMILNDIPPQALPDYQTEWSDQDLAEFTQQTWDRTDDSHPEKKSA